MSDLSEISASLNEERMNYTVKRNVKHNTAPRLMPSSARASTIDDSFASEGLDSMFTPCSETRRPPSPPPEPTVTEDKTSEISKSEKVVKFVEDEDKTKPLHDFTTGSESLEKFVVSHPTSCLAGSAGIALLAGLIIGTSLLGTSSKFRGVGVSTSTPKCKRVIEDMLHYA